MATSRIISPIVVRIDTPVGQLIVREDEVCRNVAPLLLLPLQKMYSSHNFVSVEEQVACLKGEPFDREVLFNACTDRSDLSHTVIGGTLASAEKGSDIELLCVDGEVVLNKEVLMRRFHLIDDYFTDHPQEKSITLPFTTDEVLASVWIRGNLVDCYNCLLHLNPKSNLYPFLFGMVGLPYSIFLSFARSVCEEETKTLLDFAYRTMPNYVVPERRVPYTLNIFPSVARNRDLMKSIFCGNYPSYLFCTLFNGREFPSSDGLSALQTWDFTVNFDDAAEGLFSWDFSRDEADAWYSAGAVERKIRALILLYNQNSIEGLAKDKNREVPRVLPYGITYPAPETTQSRNSELRMKLAAARR